MLRVKSSIVALRRQALLLVGVGTRRFLILVFFLILRERQHRTRAPMFTCRKYR